MFHGGNWWTLIRAEEDARPQISSGLLRRVWGYARPYRLSIALVLVGILLNTLIDAALPLVVRDLLNVAIPQRHLERLHLLALFLVGIPLVGGLINVWQRRHSARVGEGIIRDLRAALYGHLQRMSFHFFTTTRSGELIARLNNDVVGAQRAITGTLIDLITNVVTLTVTLVVILGLNWQLTLLATFVLPLFILPARRVGGALRRLTRAQMEANAEMTALMQETLGVNGALLVKLFGRQEDMNARFYAKATRVGELGVRTALIGRAFFVIIGLVAAVGTATVYWLGGYLAIRGVLRVGDIVAFALYLPRLYGPLAALINARVDLATSLVSFERVFEILDLPVAIADAPDARPLLAVQGRVEFEHVWFAYPAGGMPLWRGGDGDGTRPVLSPPPRRWALEDVSFTVEPGQLVALVGPSGAGKTTITYLLPRLYEPDRGVIRIDGHDIRRVTLASLSAAIGMVTQETYLFHDTVRANLLFARPDATEAELIAACRAANIHDRIAALPDGYDTVVGERGYRFSGGEKQRLAIARVILKDPRILVLDEATSSLDSESERLVQEALARLMRGRTSLVIAHRLSTILTADRILVLDEGRIVEQGTHAELLRRGGLYARLYHTQFQTVTG